MPKFDLTRIPPLALREIADAIQTGDEKYDRWDWLDEKDGSEDVSAALRHISHFLAGHDRDQESELLHLAHAAARLCYVIERQMRGKDQGEWRAPAAPKSYETLIPIAELRESPYEEAQSWGGESSKDVMISRTPPS